VRHYCELPPSLLCRSCQPPNHRPLPRPVDHITLHPLCRCLTTLSVSSSVRHKWYACAHECAMIASHLSLTPHPPQLQYAPAHQLCSPRPRHQKTVGLDTDPTDRLIDLQLPPLFGLSSPPTIHPCRQQPRNTFLVPESKNRIQTRLLQMRRSSSNSICGTVYAREAVHIFMQTCCVWVCECACVIAKPPRPSKHTNSHLVHLQQPYRRRRVFG